MKKRRLTPAELNKRLDRIDPYSHLPEVEDMTAINFEIYGMKALEEAVQIYGLGAVEQYANDPDAPETLRNAAVEFLKNGGLNNGYN